MERDEERRLEELLAPLRAVEPVLPRARPRRNGRRLAVTAAVVALAATGGGLAIASQLGGPLSRATLIVGGEFACTPLIGLRAEEAERWLRDRGYTIEWRFMTWGTTVVQTGHGDVPGAVAGYASAPDSVPSDSVVWDVNRTTPGRAVIVSVHREHDPDAPKVVAECREPT